jgi:hypothetical protein
MSKKLTPWFDGTTNPPRVGVYERREKDSLSGPTFQHWDGAQWGFCAISPARAMSADERGASIQQFDAQWRGLASDPKASKP